MCGKVIPGGRERHCFPEDPESATQTTTSRPMQNTENKRWHFSSHIICLEIDGWPHPAARRKTKWQNHWMPYRPSVNFESRHIRLGPIATQPDDVAPFFTSVPNEICEIVQQFPVGNKMGQWELLRLASRTGQPALDLMHSNPVLAFLLAAQQDRPATSENLQTLVSISQKVLCEHLGFPGTKWMGKLLRKMTCADLDIERLNALRRTIQNENIIKPLQHVSRITGGVLRLLIDPITRPHVTIPLLEEIAQNQHDRPDIWIQQTLNLAQILDKPLDRIAFSSLSEVWQHQDRFTRERGKRLQNNLGQQLATGRPPVFIAPTRRKRRPKLRLPVPIKRDPFTPPLPGTDAIRPLTSELLIRSWAREQNNCLASKISRVHGKDYYLYQILDPEKASLAIRLQGSKWVITELKGKYNCRVKIQTRQMIKNWLIKTQG